MIAHSLRSLECPPPVSLLLRLRRSARELADKGGVRVLRNGHGTLRDGIEFELSDRASVVSLLPGSKDVHVRKEHIGSMVVTTKAQQTASALLPFLPRLSRRSTIVVIQNGVGVLDELEQRVFPNPDTRPNIVLGVATHGVFTHDPFVVEHAGLGNIRLALVPRSADVLPDVGRLLKDPETASAGQILRLLMQCTNLSCVSMTYQELFLTQLEKLVVNCVINPLTTVFDCTNGDLVNNASMSVIMNSIISEACAVLHTLPQVQQASHLRFTTGRLRKLVVQAAHATSKNVSSMRQDALQRKTLEIDYINGYIVQQGQDHGIAVPMNATLMEMTKARACMARKTPIDRVPDFRTKRKL